MKSHLCALGKLDELGGRDKIKTFVNDYLRQDGVFILRLMSHNTNRSTTTVIACSLWKRFQAHMKDIQKHKRNQVTMLKPHGVGLKEKLILESAEVCSQAGIRVWPLLGLNIGLDGRGGISHA